jgi:hypothetical protein
VLSDTRTTIFVHGALVHTPAEHAAILSRSLPMRAFGPSARRLDGEDALLVHCLLIARAGFDVPMLDFIDLRELVLGAPSMGGPYGRALDASVIATRAKAWKAERALWGALSVVERLWPETAAAVTPLKPELNLIVRETLERAVVRPAADIGRTEGLKGEEVVRSLLAGD